MDSEDRSVLPPFRVRRILPLETTNAAISGKSSVIVTDRVSNETVDESSSANIGREYADGIVRLMKHEYEDLIRQQPQAALRYVDETDSEVVVVGSAFELDQRLQETPSRSKRISRTPSRGLTTPVVSATLHAFDIERQLDVIKTWQLVHERSQDHTSLPPTKHAQKQVNFGQTSPLAINGPRSSTSQPAESAHAKRWASYSSRHTPFDGKPWIDLPPNSIHRDTFGRDTSPEEQRMASYTSSHPTLPQAFLDLVKMDNAARAEAEIKHVPVTSTTLQIGSSPRQEKEYMPLLELFGNQLAKLGSSIKDTSLTQEGNEEATTSTALETKSIPLLQTENKSVSELIPKNPGKPGRAIPAVPTAQPATVTEPVLASAPHSNLISGSLRSSTHNTFESFTADLAHVITDLETSCRSLVAELREPLVRVHQTSVQEWEKMLRTFVRVVEPVTGQKPDTEPEEPTCSTTAHNEHQSTSQSDTKGLRPTSTVATAIAEVHPHKNVAINHQALVKRLEDDFKNYHDQMKLSFEDRMRNEERNFRGHMQRWNVSLHELERCSKHPSSQSRDAIQTCVTQDWVPAGIISRRLIRYGKDEGVPLEQYLVRWDQHGPENDVWIDHEAFTHYKNSRNMIERFEKMEIASRRSSDEERIHTNDMHNQTVGIAGLSAKAFCSATWVPASTDMRIAENPPTVSSSIDATETIIAPSKMSSEAAIPKKNVGLKCPVCSELFFDLSRPGTMLKCACGETPWSVGVNNKPNKPANRQPSDQVPERADGTSIWKLNSQDSPSTMQTSSAYFAANTESSATKSTPGRDETQLHDAYLAHSSMRGTQGSSVQQSSTTSSVTVTEAPEANERPSDAADSHADGPFAKMKDDDDEPNQPVPIEPRPLFDEPSLWHSPSYFSRGMNERRSISRRYDAFHPIAHAKLDAQVMDEQPNEDLTNKSPTSHDFTLQRQRPWQSRTDTATKNSKLATAGTIAGPPPPPMRSLKSKQRVSAPSNTADAPPRLNLVPDLESLLFPPMMFPKPELSANKNLVEIHAKPEDNRQSADSQSKQGFTTSEWSFDATQGTLDLSAMFGESTIASGSAHTPSQAPSLMKFPTYQIPRLGNFPPPQTRSERPTDTNSDLPVSPWPSGTIQPRPSVPTLPVLHTTDISDNMNPWQDQQSPAELAASGCIPLPNSYPSNISRDVARPAAPAKPDRGEKPMSIPIELGAVPKPEPKYKSGPPLPKKPATLAALPTSRLRASRPIIVTSDAAPTGADGPRLRPSTQPSRALETAPIKFEVAQPTAQPLTQPIAQTLAQLTANSVSHPSTAQSQRGESSWAAAERRCEEQLLEMGFPAAQATLAARDAKGELENAIDLLEEDARVWRSCEKGKGKGRASGARDPVPGSWDDELYG